MTRKRNRSTRRAINAVNARGLSKAELAANKAKRKRQVAPLLSEDTTQTLERNGYVYVKRFDPQRGWEIAEYTVASYQRHQAWQDQQADADQQQTVDWLRSQR